MSPLTILLRDRALILNNRSYTVTALEYYSDIFSEIELIKIEVFASYCAEPTVQPIIIL